MGKRGTGAEASAAQGEMSAAAATAFNFFLPFQRVVRAAQLRQHFHRSSGPGIP